MAIISSNDIFFTPFEPKQANRFMLLVDGIPSYMIKGVSAITMTQGVVTLNHMNVERKVKGKSKPGRVKKSGASCKGSVTSLRAKAKKYGGEKGKMYHWCANMKGGKKK